ncbi:MAG: copper resistance protein NlpE N-terminal domain-containing protein [Chitinophagaceae bacterium]
MKTFSILLIVIIIGVFGWFVITTYAEVKPALSTMTVTDTMLVVKDSIINAKEFDSIPAGFYQGMLPCKNCEGLQRTIMFSGNQFKMEELEWGKGTAAKKTEGTWEKLRGKFILSVNDKAMSEYRLVKDSLINVENNGSRIPDSLSKHNVLFKKSTPPENLSWKKRKSEGIDIVGNGSDPFWSIEIDNEKLILFKLAGSAKPVIVPIERPVITRDSTFYSIVTEAGAVLKISIGSKFCNDGISDHLYEYKMTVWYKGEIYKGCAVILNSTGQD